MSGSFHIPYPSPGAGWRLAVFHHAGGSGLSFLRLAKALVGRVEVLLGELPGRGRRYREPAPASLVEFAEEAASSLVPYQDRPLQLYGHSMGALVAYETARRLSFPVERLVVSACRPPGLEHGPPALRGAGVLSDEFLLQIMAGYGPLPKELSSPEAQSYFLPLFRHDLELLRSYPLTREQVGVPILALGGREDPVVSEGDVKDWAAYTQSGFEFRMLSGGHFFVFNDPASFAKIF